ncbi:MAG TPA: hypothetical protein VLE70_20425 [Anaerolineae bacterium]|jgi:hypothetical protein|nr:hypothetical protein [Anaerolineae bacterium]
MEDKQAVAEGILANFTALLTGGLDDERSAEVKSAFTRWIEAKLDTFDAELYSEERYVNEIIPDEIRYQFEGLDTQGRYERAMTAYDQLRLARMSEASFERAQHYLRGKDDPEALAAESEHDLAQIRDIEARLSRQFPATYERVKRQISESKLDCMYVARGGGAASLRLGRIIQRQ